MDLFSPSSSRSISLTVSPDRVLNFFLSRRKHTFRLFQQVLSFDLLLDYETIKDLYSSPFVCSCNGSL